MQNLDGPFIIDKLDALNRMKTILRERLEKSVTLPPGQFHRWDATRPIRLEEDLRMRNAGPRTTVVFVDSSC